MFTPHKFFACECDGRTRQQMRVICVLFVSLFVFISGTMRFCMQGNVFNYLASSFLFVVTPLQFVRLCQFCTQC
jgi:hypothetical protein